MKNKQYELFSEFEKNMTLKSVSTLMNNIKNYNPLEIMVVSKFSAPLNIWITFKNEPKYISVNELNQHFDKILENLNVYHKKPFKISTVAKESIYTSIYLRAVNKYKKVLCLGYAGIKDSQSEFYTKVNFSPTREIFKEKGTTDNECIKTEYNTKKGCRIRNSENYTSEYANIPLKELNFKIKK